jgi:hypothetical protein
MFTTKIVLLKGRLRIKRKVALLGLAAIFAQTAFERQQVVSAFSSSPLSYESQRSRLFPSFQSGPHPTYLEPGKSVTGEISGKQKRNYQVELISGQYARIDFSGSDVIGSIQLYDVHGEEIDDYALEPKSETRQMIEIVPDATGRYRLEVEAKSADSAIHTYTIQLAVVRAASDEELTISQARRLDFSAGALMAARSTIRRWR